MGGGPAPTYIKPLTTPPLCAWGFYPSGRVHNALDYPTPVGTKFRVARAGVVKVASWSNTGFGNHIRVLLDDGNTVIYGHLSRFLVKVGDRVSAGQFIGLTGNTGNSTGPHLHMEVRSSSWAPWTAWNFTWRLVNYAAPTTTATTTPEEDDMSAEQYQSIINLLKKYDESNQLRANSLARKLDILKEAVGDVDEAVWNTPVLRDGANVPVIQEVADAKTFTRRILDALKLTQP